MTLEETTRVDEVINMLTSNGYTCELTTVTKNNVARDAIKIHAGTLCVGLPIEHILYRNNDEVLELLDQILKDNSLDRVIQTLTDEDLLRKNVSIRIEQMKSTPGSLYRNTQMKGVGKYMVVCIEDKEIEPGHHEQQFVRINSDMLDKIPIPEDELWDIAETNTFTDENIYITDIGSLMARMAGFPEPISFTYPGNPIFVITTPSLQQGAVQIFNPRVLKWMDDNHIQNAYFYPSSINEVILIIPENETPDAEEARAMIKECNENVVCPSEVLSDEFYQLHASGYISTVKI